jgi:hypothetical protein
MQKTTPAFSTGVWDSMYEQLVSALFIKILNGLCISKIFERHQLIIG